MNQPLAAKLRPTTLDQIVGQEHLLAAGSPLRRMIESGELRTLILYGPAGTGKTTIARVIANHVHLPFVALNATNATVKEVRKVGEDSVKAGQATVLFVDEIHRFSKTQQDALLAMVEEGIIVFIGATTENPFHSVNSPLISRSQIFQLNALNSKQVGLLMVRAIKYLRGTTPNFSLSKDAFSHVLRVSCGDGRKAISVVEMLNHIYRDAEVSLEQAQAVAPNKYTVFSEDMHYDLASAFQGSIQASDPDAAIYWLAKWLESGEDPRYIARRLLVSAAEDAFSNPLCTAVAHAAYRAAAEIGRPECDIVMAQATIMIANSPRDKTAANAIWEAVRDVKHKLDLEIPKEMRDSHYEGAKMLGQGAYHDGVNQAAYVGISKTYVHPIRSNSLPEGV
jgi:putative ATPase